MWLLPVVAGAIVPHAPLLLPELESPEIAAAADAIRQGLAGLVMDVDVVVILSPHSVRPGVYSDIAGDLSAFGVPGIEAKAETDEGVARALGLPVLEGPVDHGILVPLLLRSWELPVVGVGIAGGTRINTDLEARTGLVASINLSAGLSDRGPWTAIEGAAEAEAAFVTAIQDDVGAACDFPLPGSCGASAVREFARIFESRSARVLAHEAPVGVGYLVAEVV